MPESTPRSAWMVLNSDDFVAFEFVENLDATLSCGYEYYGDFYIQESHIRGESLPLSLYTVGDTISPDSDHKLPETEDLSFPQRIVTQFYPIDDIEGGIIREQSKPFFVTDNEEEILDKNDYLYPEIQTNNKYLTQDTLTVVESVINKERKHQILHKHNKEEDFITDEILYQNKKITNNSLDNSQENTENDANYVTEYEETIAIEKKNPSKSKQLQNQKIVKIQKNEEELSVDNSIQHSTIQEVVEKTIKYQKKDSDPIIEEIAIRHAEQVVNNIIQSNKREDKQNKSEPVIKQTIVEKVPEQVQANIPQRIEKTDTGLNEMNMALQYQEQIVEIKQSFDQKMQDFIRETNERVDEKIEKTWTTFLHS